MTDLRKRHAGTSGFHDEVFHDVEHLLRTLTKTLDGASASHRKLDPAEGLQDAQLDNGSRLHIVHNHIGRHGHVLVNIRKFSGIHIRRLDELVDWDMLDAPGQPARRAGDPTGRRSGSCGPGWSLTSWRPASA